MNTAFEEAQVRAAVPGSVVLNDWRAKHGPEATRKVSNMTGGNQYTLQELSSFMGNGMVSSAGTVVNEATAMRVSAVYACVALRAGAIASMPIDIFQRGKDGPEPANDHTYWSLFNEEPEPDMAAAVFWEYVFTGKMFHGDGFAEIIRPSFRSSRMTALKAHHPLRVQPFRDTAGVIWYRIFPIVGASYVLHPADIIHIPSLGFDGLRSPSAITYAARQSTGTALAAGEYNARFFSNGARPDFALTTPNDLKPDAAQLLRTTWGERHSGLANAHLPAILTGGLDIKQLTLSSLDAQILQTLNWSVEDICRFLGVPPFMVGSTEKSTAWGTGQESMGRGFVKYTLNTDLVKTQQELKRKVWPGDTTMFVKHDVTGIERGDLLTENQALRIALGRAGEPGWMSVNDVRRVKKLPPRPDGNTISLGIPAGTPPPPPAPGDAIPGDPASNEGKP